MSVIKRPRWTIEELCECICECCTTAKEKIFNNGKDHCCNPSSCRAYLVGHEKDDVVGHEKDDAALKFNLQNP